MNKVNKVNKEKQVEELAELIFREADCSLSGQDCLVIATLLVDQDYHRHSESAWIFHSDGSATCKRCGKTQKNIWDMDNFQSYCGCCGAKMKGK